MNKGLISFKFRQYYMSTVYVTIGMLMFGFLMVGAYNAFGLQKMDLIMQGSEDLMKAFLGSKGVLLWDFAAYLAMAWRHPIILVVLIGLAASLGSGFAAKEIGDKTADLVFARPMTRSRLLWHDFFVAKVLLGTATMIFSSALYYGAQAFDLNPPALSSFMVAWLQYFVFSLVVLTLSYLVGSFVGEGKTVIAVISGIFAVMYTIELVGGLWDKVEPLKALSLFTYLTPHDALLSKPEAWRDIVILLTVTAVAFSLTLVQMERRDLS